MPKLQYTKVVALILAAVCAFLFWGSASAASVTVTTTSDVVDGDTSSIAGLIATPGADGVVSLREAILAAENTPGADTINFNIPGCGGACTITPSSGNLPALASDSTTIDGYSQPGAVMASSLTPAVILIELDGSHATTTIGLQLSSAGNVVRGMAINRFSVGVKITGSGASGNTVEGCHIGTDPTGLVDLGNSDQGVLISLTAHGNTIGGDEAKERNVISGNDGDGIRLQDYTTQDNLILGNYIGPDASGSGDLGNTFNGVTIWSSASGNEVGGLSAGERNVISGNGIDGVTLSGSGVTGNNIVNNLIGLAANGADLLPNGQNGIQILNGAIGNTVGGDVPGAGNVISANGASGVLLSGASTHSNMVTGNLIGTDASGALARGNSSEGIRISSDSHDNIIGGDTPQERNLISCNGQGGVRILGGGATNNVVSGNFIGTDVNGVAPLGNTSNGVEIATGAHNNTIGGTSAAEGNLISANTLAGVALSGSGTYSNTVSANRIGTDATGALALPNLYGITLGDSAHDNLVGGYAIGESNLISGNAQQGVRIFTNAASNTLVGNYIGTDLAGTSDLGNGSDGIQLLGGASTNLIGGSPAGAGNVISGNDGNGVSLQGSGTLGNTIEGNWIGVDATGMTPLANSQDGIGIEAGASGNTIGGATIAHRNVISANGQNGIQLQGTGTNDNTILANLIGLAVDGDTDLGNAYDGIYLVNGAQYNIIGSSFYAARNVISGNDGNGITLNSAGTAFNELVGNFIGTNQLGNGARENGGTGVALGSGVHDTVIGGDQPGEGNLISGNHFMGVLISGSGTTANTVAGNKIGTDYSGVIDLGNGSNGVAILSAAEGNQIGGTTSGSRNLISGNDSYGVQIMGIGTYDNLILGNYIGVDVSGTAPVANSSHGIYIWSGAQGTIIGGSGAGNVISGNLGSGIALDGNGTNYNRVEGNLIGLDASGLLAVGNGYNGVQITLSATANTVGGDTPGERNVISGNANHGVGIYNTMTAGNVVSGNYIGTDISGSADLGNVNRGVDIGQGAESNTIGGDSQAEGNVISGNADGVNLSGSGTDANVIKNNLIGTDASGVYALPNDSFGVDIYNGPQGNTTGPHNVIAFNGTIGLRVEGGSTYENPITQNSIHGHPLGGIKLTSGSNAGILAPLITGASFGSPILIEGTACADCTVEVFANPDSDGEGWIYLGSVTADGLGDYSMATLALPYPYLTATATDLLGNTSEFSAVFTSSIHSLFLPLIAR